MSDNRDGAVILILFAVSGVWLLFGDPKTRIADWLWPERQAPWETVDAFYYPNANDLSEWREALGLDSVDACRDWVQAQATIDGDPGMHRTDYECGLGEPTDHYGLRVYRNTVD